MLVIGKLSVQNIDVDRQGVEDGAVGEEEEGEEGGREGESGSLGHLPSHEASQDTELMVTGASWDEGEEGREPSQEPESPHLTPRKTNWSQGNFRTS